MGVFWSPRVKGIPRKEEAQAETESRGSKVNGKGCERVGKREGGIGTAVPRRGFQAHQAAELWLSYGLRHWTGGVTHRDLGSLRHSRRDWQLIQVTSWQRQDRDLKPLLPPRSAQSPLMAVPHTWSAD